MAVHERLLKTDPKYKSNMIEIERFTKEYVKRNAKLGLRTGIITIPVVVHVVYNTSTQNISNAQINSQITILNNDYRKLNSDAGLTPAAFQSVAADTRIQFQLAVRDPNCNTTTGITRTSTTITSFTDNDDVKFNARGGHDAWPRDKYLNLWVCPLAVLPVIGQLLGYAQFPGGSADTDGVVIHYTAFGDTGTALAPFNRGRTTTHEIGHWLNLRHIWGDAVCGDDSVADTPVHDGANTGCPAQPHYSTCTGTPREMTMNYMDYTDDACMYMLTAGQAARMDACLMGTRSALLGSDALIPSPATATADLWSQDTPEDLGNEPNTASACMYLSDDIWVRRQNDGLTNQEHQNPEYRAASSTPNYVYVRIRNRGCSSSASGTDKLYWAKASTALGWPAPWDGSITTPVLMGGLIGSKSTGTVAGGSFVILEFPWYPPNPADYMSFGADKSHFCLLSRIETSASSPYGMTSPEGSNLNSNVKNNNNIIWKNITVLDPSTAKKGWVTVGNITQRTSLTKLTFTCPKETKEAIKSLLAYGEVEVNLGRRLFGLWNQGGQLGSGVKASGRTRISIISCDAWIGNLKLAPNELDTISFQVVTEAELPVGYNVFYLDIAQYEIVRRVERLVGGQRFMIKTAPARRIP